MKRFYFTYTFQYHTKNTYFTLHKTKTKTNQQQQERNERTIKARNENGSCCETKEVQGI